MLGGRREVAPRLRGPDDAGETGRREARMIRREPLEQSRGGGGVQPLDEKARPALSLELDGGRRVAHAVARAVDHLDPERALLHGEA